MSTEFTVEEKAANFDTMRHIERVRNLLNEAIRMLLDAGEEHDQCKMEEPELSEFAAATPALSALTYGTPEFEENKKKLLQNAMAHHYARSTHHPEHFANGINDMDLLHLIEMFLDWKASSERHTNGNILKSIDHNVGRFEMSPQLARIFRNTAARFEGK